MASAALDAYAQCEVRIVIARGDLLKPVRCTGCYRDQHGIAGIVGAWVLDRLGGLCRGGVG